MISKKQTSFQEFLRDFVVGGVSASVSKIAYSPKEVMLIGLMDQPRLLEQGLIEKQAYNIPTIVSQIYKREGLRGFFSTNGVFMYSFIQALNFAWKDTFIRVFNKNREKDGYNVWFASNIVSGGLAGLATTVVTYPIDFVRAKQINDLRKSTKGREKNYNGLIDVYKKTIQTDGIVGLYKGFVIQSIGVVIYRGLYFGLYDSVKPMLPKSIQNNFMVNYLVGWIATALGDLASYPIDYVRRRQSYVGSKYNGSIDCARQILQKEGVKQFFKNSTYYIRGVKGALTLSGYDYIQRLIDSNTQPNSE